MDVGGYSKGFLPVPIHGNPVKCEVVTINLCFSDLTFSVGQLVSSYVITYFVFAPLKWQSHKYCGLFLRV